jgi:hypothetical protein
MLNFSMYQSGIDFKSPYSNRPLSPNPRNRLTQSLFSSYAVAKCPDLFNWYMSSAVDLHPAPVTSVRSEKEARPRLTLESV